MSTISASRSNTGGAVARQAHPSFAARDVVPVVTRRILYCALEELPDSLVLRVRGDVDLETAPEFARAVGEALARGKSTLIDLSAVTYFDGQGIRVLREYANLTRATLKLPAQVRRSLETLGIDYLFRFQ